MSEQAEPIAILERFSALADPRQAWKVLYPLPGRNIMNVKRKYVAWGTELLAQVLTGVPN